MKNKKHRLDLTLNRLGLALNKCFRFLARITYGSIVIATVASPAWAETQNKMTNDASFGRLFTTPEQRKSLDEVRRQGGLKSTPQVTNTDDNATLAATQINQQPAQPFKLSGVLMRADGQHQVWVSGENGKRENPDFSRKILGSISQSANVKVPLQGNNRAAILKPGQVWLPDSARAEESYRLAVPKPVVVVEPIKKRAVPPAASSSASAQTSASVSEVHSSVQSSTK